MSNEAQRSLKLLGFGACMIKGYPLDSKGFFYVAAEEVRAWTPMNVQADVLSFGGFPAHRAAKHLQSQAVPRSPDYLIIQFGSTDAACPLRKSRVGAKRPRKATPAKPASLFSIWRWQLRSAVCFVAKPEPISALDVYLAAMESIVSGCIASSITPIVLSPFILGGAYSLRSAKAYTESLKEMLHKFPEAIFIDCIVVLSQLPRAKALIADGVHLSELGHRRVGLALAAAILGDLQRSRP